MMSGYVDDRPASCPTSGACRYQVLPRDGGWCVAVNGCRTEALPRRKAERLARALQVQADRLNHRPAARR
ncbi:hypothetical protein [Brevundimonas lenta]|uniref:DUF2188 domain-containing protein n=1 Tax=Brevundimonas lenta TaxID=424796 RepID=A0A7W6JBB7_9CAUL|nr:hypothetical protein [Brevundimonas lenta]MBB4081968.1 hypothetical protein [Brevundimonas lenta]